MCKQTTSLPAMMLDVLLTHNRKGRIWIAALPDRFLFEPLGHVERRFSSPSRNVINRKIAVELLIPRGARFDYGLVGGELIGNDSNVLVVTLGHTTTEGLAMSDSLADQLDEVNVGLPFEYANAALDGIASAESARALLPAGQLKVRWAAPW